MLFGKILADLWRFWNFFYKFGKFWEFGSDITASILVSHLFMAITWKQKIYQTNNFIRFSVIIWGN